MYGAKGARPAAIDLRKPPPSTVIIYGADAGDAYGEELYAGDFNGDGRLDAMVAPGQVLINRGEGQFILGIFLNPGFEPTGGAAADYDPKLFRDICTAPTTSSTARAARRGMPQPCRRPPASASSAEKSKVVPAAAMSFA